MMLKKICFFLLVFSLIFIQYLSAQGTCNNIDNRDGTNTGNNYIAGGESFGQTFIAESSCLGGNAFSQITIRGNGNSTSRWNLFIYEGEVLPGGANALTAMYSQEAIVFPPGNFGADLSAELGGGTGSLNFNDGQMYTVYLVNTGGNMLINTTKDAIPGKVMAKGQFFPNNDLRFSLTASDGGTEPAVAGCRASDYPTVEINGKTWLAENLHCKLTNPESGWCLKPSDPVLCAEYSSGYYNFENAKRACESLGDGWRLPTLADWREMLLFIDPGAILDYNNNSTNALKAALVSGGSSGLNLRDSGGYRYSDAYDTSLNGLPNRRSYYWSSTASDDSEDMSYHLWIVSNDPGESQRLKNSVFLNDHAHKTDALNCRCVKD